MAEIEFEHLILPEDPIHNIAVISEDPASRITLVINNVCGGLYLSQIAVLDPLVAQQVAAGQVVDRPASVPKRTLGSSH